MPWVVVPVPASLVLAANNDFGSVRTDFLRMILTRRNRKDLAGAICPRDVALRDRKRTCQHEAAHREGMSMLIIARARSQRLCLDFCVAVFLKTGLKFLLVHACFLIPERSHHNAMAPLCEDARSTDGRPLTCSPGREQRRKVVCSTSGRSATCARLSKVVTSPRPNN